MEIPPEAAGDALTGAVVAATVEGDAGPGKTVTHGKCQNCGAELRGAYCAACGQPAHIHRSLASLGHDILHGVFHFEGKFWQTLPELLFHPGRLTRRYIDGERAKFVSPMALYLFSVFLMFAVVPMIVGHDEEPAVPIKPGQLPSFTNWKMPIATALDESNRDLEKLKKERDEKAAGMTPDELVKFNLRIANAEKDQAALDALSRGDWKALSEMDKKEPRVQAKPAGNSNRVNLGWPWLDNLLSDRLQKANTDPALLAYKLKVSGYKYSWALIPISVPFLWLLFFWKRNVHLYDHAIFATYSISFVMLLVILLSLASMLGAGAWLWWFSFLLLVPFHMYKQLRGTYGIGRFSAVVRLHLMLFSIVFILVAFVMLLLVMGLLS
jgi:hypothetical protein